MTVTGKVGPGKSCQNELWSIDIENNLNWNTLGMEDDEVCGSTYSKMAVKIFIEG